MPVGYYGFEPLIQATQQNIQQKDYTGQALAQLGGQIKQSLSEQAMRSEASHAAPLLQQQYAQAFDNIQKGNVADGLGQVYGASAQYAGNPLIQQYAQKAQESAGLLAHGYIQGSQAASLQQGRIANDIAKTNFIQGEQNKRTEYTQQNANYRAGVTGYGKGQLTANEKIKAVEQFNKQATDNISQLDSTNPEEFLNAYEQYSNTRNALNSAGLAVSNPHYEKAAHDKLDALNKQLDDYAKAIKAGETKDGWFGGKITDLVQQIQEQKDRIIKASKNGLRDGYSTQPGQPPQGQGGPNIPDGTFAVNPSTGVRMVRQGGQWQPVQ